MLFYEKVQCISEAYGSSKAFTKVLALPKGLPGRDAVYVLLEATVNPLQLEFKSVLTPQVHGGQVLKRPEL